MAPRGTQLQPEREQQLQGLAAHLADLNGNSFQRSLTVSGVAVEGPGADRTSRALLHPHAAPLLAATTVKDLVAAADLVQRALVGLDIYQDVGLSFDAKTPGQLTANLFLPAAKRFVAQTGTSFGSNEGNGYIKGTMKNYFGYGEIVSLDTSVGTRTKSASLVQASLPLAGWLPLFWRGEFLAYGSQKDIDWVSQKQQVRGLTFRVTNPVHNMGIDAVLRSAYSTRQRPTLESSKQAGHALKLAAFYNWTQDTRDKLFLPSRGACMKISHELAAGDHPYFKSTLDYIKAANWNQYSCSISAKVGGLLPLGSESHIMDRFFLGGPLDVRGFRINKLGEVADGDARGGEFVAAAGLSLFAPVPKVQNPNLKLHWFVNGGSVRMLDRQRPANTLTQMLLTPSVATGFGLVYGHQAARFELNLVMPLAAHSGEAVHKGLQFGVGLSFL